MNCCYIPTLKEVTRAAHMEMKVMLGWGKLEGLQALWTSASQWKSVEVRLVSCEAPLLSFLPPQDRPDLFPPPTSTSRSAVGENTPSKIIHNPEKEIS